MFLLLNVWYRKPITKIEISGNDKEGVKYNPFKPSIINFDLIQSTEDTSDDITVPENVMTKLFLQNKRCFLVRETTLEIYSLLYVPTIVFPKKEVN